MAERTCSIEKCPSQPIARGWCPKHYQRWKKYGDPLGSHSWPTPIERLFGRRIVIERGWTTPCWESTYAKNGDGYTLANKPGSRHVVAHRLAYEKTIGPIPEGLELDHLCRNRACWNPYHLEAVTHAENMRRGMAPHQILARNGICKQGHPVSGANLSMTKRGPRCRACAASYMRDYMKRKALHVDS